MDEKLKLALVISEFLHKKDTIQALGYHMARGLSEEIAGHILDQSNKHSSLDELPIETCGQGYDPAQKKYEELAWKNPISSGSGTTSIPVIHYPAQNREICIECGHRHDKCICWTEIQAR